MRLSFDGFELDPDGCQLYRAGEEVAVERRTLDLLCYFVAHPQRLIRKEELVERVWQARALSEGVLANTVAKLRKALGQAPDAREPLETVRGRGYRWHWHPNEHAHAGAALSSDALSAAAPALNPRVAALIGPPSAPAASGDALTSATAASTSEARDPFLARDAALAELSNALEQVVRGVGRLLLIAGEAGIGKTRLLKELEQLARARGISVWRGAGYDGGAAPAYWPWVEILRAAHQQLTAAVWHEHLPPGHSALDQLVPELCGGAAFASTQETLRFKLFDELASWLKAASAAAPRLIIIDDLHWADAAAIELLAHAARVLEPHGVLFAIAVRDRDAACDTAQLAALARVERIATRIVLSGLSQTQVSELLAALSGSGDSQLSALMFQRTGGNPLFVRQLIALLRQKDALSHAGLSQLAPAELPAAVRGVIAQRIALLDPGTRRVLSAAAVVGAEFDAFAVAALVELPLAAVLHALDVALELRVIERSGDSSGRQFVFAHALVREALYAALGSAQSGAWHGQLAQALVARSGDTDARQLATIAHHFALAVPSQLADHVRYGCKAAAAARASSGFEAAAALLMRVLEQHERESTDHIERCELLLLLGTDLACAGDKRAAWQALWRGAELARQLGAAELSAQFALELAPWLEFGGEDEDYVLRLLEEALSGLPDGAVALRTRLLAQRAPVELERPWSERERWLHEASALAAQLGTPEIQRVVVYARAVTHSPLRAAAAPHDAEAIEQYRALDAASRAAHAGHMGVQRAFTVELASYINAIAAFDSDAAAAAAARCGGLARGANLMGLSFGFDMLQAGRSLALGELGELESRILRMREAASGGGGFSLAWLKYGALLAHERGLVKMLLPHSQHLLPDFVQLPRHMRVQGELAMVWVYAHAEEHVQARSRLQSVDRALLAHMPLRRTELAPLCLLAEAYHMLGDVEGGARLALQLAPYAAENALGSTHEYLGAVAHYLGLLSELLQQRAQAHRYFTQAELLNQRLGMRLQLERTRAGKARTAA